jgi:hypothetical protein
VLGIASSEFEQITGEHWDHVNVLLEPDACFSLPEHSLFTESASFDAADALSLLLSLLHRSVIPCLEENAVYHAGKTYYYTSEPFAVECDRRTIARLNRLLAGIGSALLNADIPVSEPSSAWLLTVRATYGRC